MTSTSRQYSQLQWEALFTSTIAKLRELATLKGGEYSGDIDRLANFRHAASEQGLPPETIWRIYAGKHWDAIGTYCKDLLEGRERQRSESISGRADDLIVYLLLFKAMLEERGEAIHTGRTVRVQLPADFKISDRNVLALHEPQLAKFEPECPQTGAAHSWGRMGRHTDACVACGAMRPHVTRGR